MQENLNQGDDKYDDPNVIIHAFNVIAHAKNMTQLAKNSGLTREGLYKAISPDGNPSLDRRSVFGLFLRTVMVVGKE